MIGRSFSFSSESTMHLWRRAAFLSLGLDGVGNIFLIGYTLVLVSTIFGELVGASGPTRPFGKLDDECFAVQDPLSEALSNLSRGLIV